MEKTCNSCKQKKEIKEFSFKNKARGLRQPKCKECTRAYLTRHYAANKEVYKKRAKQTTKRQREQNNRKIIEYLSTHPCVDCGENDIVVLEFDHISGAKTTEVTIMRNAGYSWQRILKEIKKCEVRCCNCHRRRTYRNSYRAKPIA